MSFTPPDDPTGNGTPPPAAPGAGSWPPSGRPDTPPPAGPPPGGYGAPGAPGGYPPAGPPPGYPPAGPPPGYPPAGGGFPPGSGYPPGGGYGGYGGYRPPMDHPQGTTILILGILSIVCCGLLGPVAWIMGNNAIKEIDRNPAAYSNRGSVQAGRIIGIVATVLLVLGVVFYGIALIAAAGSSSSSGY